METLLLPGQHIIYNLRLVRAQTNNRADVNLPNHRRNTALTWATEKGQFETVRALIDAGADVNHQNKYYKDTALTWAAYNGHLETVRALIAAGVDVNASKHIWKHCSYLRRQERGHFETVRALIEARADVESSKRPWTTLLLSGQQRKGTLRLFELSLRPGRTLIDPNKFGDSADIRAATEGQP